MDSTIQLEGQASFFWQHSSDNPVPVSATTPLVKSKNPTPTPMPPSSSSHSYSHSEELRLYPTVRTHRYHSNRKPHSQQADDDHDDDDGETVAKTVLEVGVASVASSNLNLNLPAAASAASASAAATPFPRIASDLLLSYELERLVVQSSSSSFNSFSPRNCDTGGGGAPPMIPDARIGSPIGLSVTARFHHRSSSLTRASDSDSDFSIQHFDDKWEALLRTLSGSLLGCGSSNPFDSMREKRHQHIAYHNPTMTTSASRHHLNLGNGVYSFEEERSFLNNATAALEYRAVIPTSEGAGTSTCVDGINSFLSLLPCSHRGGIFGAGPTPDLLASADVRGTRMWIDASASASCFGADGVESDGEEGCELGLRQGISYTKIVNVDPPSSSSHLPAEPASTTGGRNADNSSLALTFTLGELLRTPREGGRYRKEMGACPLADDSVVRTYPPTYVDHHRYPGGATTTTATTTGNFAKVEFEYPPTVSERGKWMSAGKECQEGSDQCAVEEDNQRTSFALHNIFDLGGHVDLNRMWMSIPREHENLTSPSSSSCHEGEESIASTAGYNTDGGWRIDRVVKKAAGLVGVGSLETTLRNGDIRCSVEVSSVDLFPKIIKPILFSIELWLYEGKGAGGENVTSSRLTLDAMKGHRLILSKDGSVSLHLTTELPPDSSLWVSMRYDPRFLSFEDFPADPNRGVDLPPSYATFSSRLHTLGDSDLYHGGEVEACPYARAAECLPCRVTLHSPSLLLVPPLPDMSMPFNVISLTCTVYAFVIGTMINLLVRRSSGSINKALGRGEAAKDKFSKLRAILRKLSRKRSTSSKGEEPKSQ